MRSALFSRLALAVSLTLATLPVAAQDRVMLGGGRLFSNDAIGDGQDRWRTAAYAMSWMRGPEGTVALPEDFGELIEFRFGNRIMAPANTVTPARGDRRYAGIAALGGYSHLARDGMEFAIGAELVAVGPMTGMGKFQTEAHGLLGFTVPSRAVLRAQFPNAVHPTMAFEAARPVSLGDMGVVRPFLQLRAGDETYARIGADVLIGSNFNTGVLARDETTGQLYQTLEDVPAKGLSFLIGADTAKVLNSAWLPDAAGYRLTPLRHRARAGMHVQGEKFGLFYGATWLGREFTAQPEGQILGSLQVQMRF